MADEAKATEITFQRTDDFREGYANSCRFESSVWDLKLIFGTLDQSVDPSVILQRFSINVPWVQAKLMLYFLYVNVLFQEAVNGTIHVPAAITPPSIDDILGAPLKDDPMALAAVERVKKLANELFNLS